jgi:hypothetical protein
MAVGPVQLRLGQMFYERRNPIDSLDGIGPRRFNHERVATIQIGQLNFRYQIGAIPFAVGLDHDCAFEPRGTADQLSGGLRVQPLLIQQS